MRSLKIWQFFAISYKKGCSLINRRFLRRERQKWPWGEVAKSYGTLCREGLVSQSKEIFTNNYSMIKKALIAPRDRWLSLAIMNRINWNAMKQFNAEGVGEDIAENNCRNCGENIIERSRHLFVDCRKAEDLWALVSRILDEVGISLRQVRMPFIEGDMRMFNLNIPGSEITQEVYSEVAMLVRRCLYSAAFKNDQDASNIANLKFALLNRIKDLVNVRKDLGYDHILIDRILQKLQTNN